MNKPESASAPTISTQTVREDKAAPLAAMYEGKTVAELMAAAFGPERDARSPEYKAGVRTILQLRLSGVPAKIPYHLGTAQADAFFAGMEEGHSIARRIMEGASHG